MSVYLDHAATTPMYPQAARAMTAAFSHVGNPSSLHASGRAARRVVEESREAIAQALGARPGEVVFTSGGTEANNLAIKGCYWNRRRQNPRRNRIISTAIEHHAVLDQLHWLATDQGADVVLLPVDAEGRVELEALAVEIERDPEAVALVSVMWANNEVGTIQPVQEAAALARQYQIPFHTDAVQAVGQLPVNFADSGADALTLTGHKVGGPFGVGALIVRRELALTPLIHGGGQEREIRSGTIDAPAIAGFAAAVELAVDRQPELSQRLVELRRQLVEGVLGVVPDAICTGAIGADPKRRLPGNAHLRFPDCEGDSLLMLLDAKGIECSTGSACDAGVAQASHVLLAMGCSDEEARTSLRFSMGHTTTSADIEALVSEIGPAVERARAAVRVMRGR